ncbi:DUF3124 domain-containing protein [Pontibacter sp. G13]|uniref:DUF3124 domain-containing protein n=1 Tax=Pontibacter sp. G13 TaxID=3074898 RepID=UPI00288A7F5D|nr:DUF3124 domain-containing protein [Pontibacter sp. G13]WNJ18407.1 DUF3124 domain-containing protein [Pontibacter sp. G13]
MGNKMILGLLILILSSCDPQPQQPTAAPRPVNWDNRTAMLEGKDSLEAGSSYLSIYSQIYSISEQRTTDLTVTVSLRNPSLEDTVFISKAQYFDTQGTKIHDYLPHPIFIAPMETVELVIHEIDKTGGTGANFHFDWQKSPNGIEPLFEAVMISTYGQRGLSFTTQGVRIK